MNMKRSDIFDDQDRAFGMLHLMVEDFRAIPLAERYCDRFEGEPTAIFSNQFLREHLWEFELADNELYSYSLFLQTNMKMKYIEILQQVQLAK